jgi:four helix bundle protein
MQRQSNKDYDWDFDLKDVIVYVLPNPKKPGSAARERYFGYQLGLSVEETLEKTRVTEDDVAWDKRRGHIRLGKANESDGFKAVRRHSAPSVWDMDVFKKAYRAGLKIHQLSLAFPKHEQFELASQLRRSSKSICANLAEGRAKQQGSSAEFRRYVLMALGSADETLLWCRFANDLGYLDEATATEVAAMVSEIARMLNGLASTLKMQA